MHAPWPASTSCTEAPGTARASSSWRPGGTTWSRVVTTTAVGTSIWLIQLAEVNWQTARMAETALARVVRLSWARAHGRRRPCRSPRQPENRRLWRPRQRRPVPRAHSPERGQAGRNRWEMGSRARSRVGNALAPPPGCRQVRPVVIKYQVPEVSDREVQFADGLLDFPGRTVIADQPRHGFQRQARREQPARHGVVHALGDLVAILGRAQCRLRRAGYPPVRGTASRPDSGVPSRYHTVAGHA